MNGPLRRQVFIDVGGDTCPLKGSKVFMEALRRAIEKAGLKDQVEVIPRGCFGLCKLAPNLFIDPEGVWYSRFTVKDIPAIVRKHLVKGQLVERLIHYPERTMTRRRNPKAGSRRGKAGHG